MGCPRSWSPGAGSTCSCPASAACAGWPKDADNTVIGFHRWDDCVVSMTITEGFAEIWKSSLGLPRCDAASFLRETRTRRRAGVDAIILAMGARSEWIAGYIVQQLLPRRFFPSRPLR